MLMHFCVRLVRWRRPAVEDISRDIFHLKNLFTTVTISINVVIHLTLVLLSACFIQCLNHYTPILFSVFLSSCTSATNNKNILCYCFLIFKLSQGLSHYSETLRTLELKEMPLMTPQVHMYVSLSISYVQLCMTTKAQSATKIILGGIWWQEEFVLLVCFNSSADVYTCSTIVSLTPFCFH